MRMRHSYWLSALVPALLIIGSVQAAPPEGKGKPMDMKSTEMKTSADEKMEEAEQTKEMKKEKMKGLEKQKEMKSEQMQKEMGKGSDQGQRMREEHRRKWWKFWGSDESETSEE